MLCWLQEVIVSERRFQYEAAVNANPQHFDNWFDYVRLEESAGDHDKVQCPFYTRYTHNINAPLPPQEPTVIPGL